MANDLPIIHIGTVELHGDLFFASLEYHDMAETLPVLHNYALTYALDLCTKETGRVSPLYDPTERRKQQPCYDQDFAWLNRVGIYVTPAKPYSTPPMIIRQYASRIDEYLHAASKLDDVLWYEKDPRKRGLNTLASIFPLHGFMKMMAPTTRLTFYTYGPITDYVPPRRYVRLGKFNAKAYVTLKPCEMIILENTAMETAYPLNPMDVAEIIPLDLMLMRPTPLAHAARLPRSLRVTHRNPWNDRREMNVRLPVAPAYRWEAG
jgi:CRISPR-associated protein Csc1